MSILKFARKKMNQEKISMVTCYDYPSAKIIAKTAIEVILVGDSVAMVVHGFDSTVMATMEMMVLHTQAVVRGAANKFVVADMPFMAHRGSMQQACKNAERLIKAGAQAIKIEGADAYTLKVINYLVNGSVPVIGHIGLQPQSILALGGYKVQGRQALDKQRLLDEAMALQEAGCFAIVLECMPEDLALNITNNLNIPTIGIGAGRYTDGQVLVWHDFLGLQNDFLPKFVKQYHVLEPVLTAALQQYHEDVISGCFPEEIHCYNQ